MNSLPEIHSNTAITNSHYALQEALELNPALHNANNLIDKLSESKKSKFGIKHTIYKGLRIGLLVFLGLQLFYVIEQNNLINNISYVTQSAQTQAFDSQEKFYAALKQHNNQAMETYFNVLLHTPEAKAQLMATWLFLEVKNNSAIPLEQRQRMAASIVARFQTYNMDLNKTGNNLISECKPLDAICAFIGRDYRQELHFISAEIAKTQYQALSEVKSWMNTHQKNINKI